MLGIACCAARTIYPMDARAKRIAGIGGSAPRCERARLASADSVDNADAALLTNCAFQCVAATGAVRRGAVRRLSTTLSTPDGDSAGDMGPERCDHLDWQWRGRLGHNGRLRRATSRRWITEHMAGYVGRCGSRARLDFATRDVQLLPRFGRPLHRSRGLARLVIDQGGP